jgi:glycosyltransferase involved in cell wall biosynthesis
MKISIIIPVKNEEETLRQLVSQINSAIANVPEISSSEIIFIDDGSEDSSWKIIQDLSLTLTSQIKGIKFRKNFGKAAALSAGFKISTGHVIFTMDADLQDDPKEIPRFLEKLNEGYDMISGWKRQRNDPISKTAPSKLFNKVTSALTGLNLHDFNCGFKCYKRELIEKIYLYGELHRYIPVLAVDLGFKVGEIEVEHHPRRHGASKYGWERYARGLIDLLTVLATTKWMHKPGHLFGGIGILLGFIGMTVLGYLSMLWLFGLGPIGNRPLLIFGVMLSIFSLQMISLGVIAEFFIKLNSPKDLNVLISEMADNSEIKD